MDHIDVVNSRLLVDAPPTGIQQLPIAVRSRSADNRPMSDRSDATPDSRPESEAEWLRRQIDAFEQRLARLERLERPERSERSMSSEATVTPPPPPAAQLPAAQLPPPPAPQPPPPPPQPAAATAPPPRPPFTLPGIESLLKWAGLVLLFLSAVFLVSTAIQRGWIGPELQLLGAACIGAGLIEGGLVLGRRRAGWGVPLVGVGIAVLSATSTAGWQWLELWSRSPWIALSFTVLALSIALNGRLRSPGVAATGLVTTAISVSVLSDSIPQAAVLLAIVVAVGEATSVWRRSSSLHLMTVVVGVVSFGAVAAASYIEAEPTSLALLLSGAVVTVLFWTMPLVFAVRDAEPSPIGVNWRPTIDRLVISLPALFSVAWTWSSDLSETGSGRVFLLTGGLALASALVVALSRRFQQSIWVSQLMGGAAAVTVGSVLLFEGPGVLAGLTLQAGALLIFVHLVPDRWAVVQAGAMATVAGLLALAGMIDAIDLDAPAVDDVVHLGVVALLAGWAWWEGRSHDDRPLGQILGVGAFAGAVLWPVSALIHVPQGQALISAVWAGLGLGLLVLAFSRTSVRLAQVSLATLGVVMVKLLTIDLETVDVFWRVALFFILGGTFLFAGFRVGTAIRLLTPNGDRTDESGADGGPLGDDSDAEEDPDREGDPDQGSGLAFQK